MIHITQQRREWWQDASRNFDFDPQKQTPDKALHLLVAHELACGGKIVSCSPTMVVVETKYWQKLDTTTFNGSEEEMKLIYRLAKSLPDGLPYDGV